jgi:hypothetical protein
MDEWKDEETMGDYAGGVRERGRAEKKAGMMMMPGLGNE